MTKYQQIARRVIPSSRVFDVGCGGGDLGCFLKEKSCIVTGWDQKLDRIHKNAEFYKLLEERDVEKEGLGNEKYDAVVFSDVLEHLYDAGKVLQQSRDLLNVGGKVLVSLPNVAYFENRLGLFKGDWNYTDEGILDRTHIRFYTLASARNFLTDAGFTIREMEPEIPIIHSAWKRNLFSFLSKNFPSLFAIGWIFEMEPIATKPSIS
jgi:2-polyprenyl-3-methyl-5-hydroxy-6-metoxy-1,4-benzoquinol methylase